MYLGSGKWINIIEAKASCGSGGRKMNLEMKPGAKQWEHFGVTWGVTEGFTAGM